MTADPASSMHTLLAGPCSTAAFRAGLGVELSGAPDGQIQTPLAPLAVELAGRGHKVHVVTLDSAVREPVRFFEGDFGISFLPMRPRARERAFDLFAAEIRLLAEEYRRVSPDVVHAHWTYEYAEAGLRSRLPLLVTAHDSPLDNVLAYRQIYRLFRLAMAVRTLVRTPHLACVSPYLRAQMRVLGYWGKIEVIPNGIRIPNGFDRAQEKHLDPRNPILVTIGNASRAKNVSASIAAFHKIRAAFPHAELHLFGDGLDAAFAGGEQGVVAHEDAAHPQVMDFLRSRAMLLIHPSRQEVCPVAIIEAMAFGVPCVAGQKSGGVPGLFPRDLSTCLVDIENPAEIARQAVRILESEDEWLRISAQAQENVQRNFSIDRITSRYEALYRVIASQT
jgi:L-malate glycosyltransferase